jgi:hypothetical protein
MKMKIALFLVMTPSDVIDKYKSFGVISRLHS